MLSIAPQPQREDTMQDRNDPADKSFDPEMTEGDEANAPEETPAETGEDENQADLAREHGIPEDPQRPT